MGELIGAFVISFLCFKFVNWIFSKSLLILKITSSAIIRISGVCSFLILVLLGTPNFGFNKAFLLYGIPTLVWYFYFSSRTKSTLPKTSSHSNDSHVQAQGESTEIKLGQIGSESEAERIHKLVAERLKEAEKKGIKELVDELYKEVKYYPAWIKREPRDYVPQIIVRAEEEDSGNKKTGIITKLFFENGELLFHFRETSSFDGTNYGDLEIEWNSQSVLTLGMAIDYSEGDQYVGPEWHPFKVEAYIPGEWESLLLKIKADIASLKFDREKRQKEDPSKIAELKKKFGL